MATSITAKRNFILQQGFRDVTPASCSLQYSALQFQPRVVLVWIILAAALRSPTLFAALALVLWFSALFPALNPFDALYNSTLGRRKSRLGPAPAPRRTAQGLAGVFAIAAAVFNYFNLAIAAAVVEAAFLAAVLALTLGGFCLGSFVYHVIRGKAQFARKTLPWAA